MDITAELDVPCPPEGLYRWVEDLSTYPQWLDIVSRAVAEDDGGWTVDLRGRLGPFARSKRLRMVRTMHDAPSAARFERQERDGRSHSAWVLSADVAGNDGGSTLTMHLHYGGGLWGPVLERMLGDEIERSKPRLVALATAAPA